MILIFHLLLLSNIYGQSTSNELGQKIFFAFKHDLLNLIDNYRLKKDELPAFFSANGLDTTSNQFLNYKSEYAEISKKLIDKCKSIENDTLENGVSWKNAELQTITLKDQNGLNLLDGNRNSHMLLEITFISDNRHFHLLVETLYGIDKKWKVGNYVSFIGELKYD